MIQEAYCSYEVAKLLKEKGFNESIRCWYDNFQDFHEEGVKMSNTDCLPPTIMCPTHQMALAWLRDVHSLCICIYYLWPCGYEIDLYRIGKDTPISEFEAIREYGYDTYEDAVETALKYTLKNLL